MPKPGFKLQKVLDTKGIFADRKKQELAQAVRTLGRERQVLAALRHTSEGYRNQALAPHPGRFDPQREVGLRVLLERLAQEIHRQQEAVTHCERRVAEKRDALMQAMTDRKMLEKLRARQEEKQTREIDADEQKDTDEVGRVAFTRGREARSKP